MKKLILLYAIILAIPIFLSHNANGQTRTRAGRVCGSPKLPCKNAQHFQSYELRFDTGRNFVIGESESFWAIILESRKMNTQENCDNVYSESHRLGIQRRFPNNKVFALKCFEPGMNYYTGVADDVGFIAVFAGRTQAEARRFLKSVQSHYPNASLRRMKAGINGT